ncbi:MAG: type II toxin-antitoxin system Phd/YefM family antitoxin [Planctomycetes bacterium]|nr:type II toxin-antitoxin system Phd/YefM family antitoxin [Planctomycetota bacterium]
MRTVNVRDARDHLAEILTQVSGGEVVILTRRGQEIARIVPPANAARPLPGRGAARAAMLKRGARVTKSAVVVQREDERA